MTERGGGDPAPSGSQQVVRVESGFGYGTIGADIHVFGDGTPLYALAQWRGARTADRDWLLESPSRLLNARHEVVEFTGREGDLAALDQWRESRPRLAVRWLHGSGGQGKTRLAAKFAARSADRGWAVVTATHGPGTVLPPPGSQDLRLRDARGLLLIVDYADRWPLTHLTWLFSNALFHKRGRPTRMLLLARTADSWPAVRACLTEQEAATSTHLLQPLTADGATADGSQAGRTQMFTAARGSFAAAYGVADPGGIDSPVPLDHEDFGLTLAIHMAALVAVDAHATGRRTPSGMAGLTVYLLDREHLYWARLHGGATHQLDPAGRTFHTPPRVMNRAVFTAALTGALPESSGRAVLGFLGMAVDVPQVLADHRVCYPPADLCGSTVLEPLYPDRLAEDFLALTLPGHAADYPAQSWAPGTVRTLLTVRTAEPPPYLARAVPTLTAAADRWPHVAREHLYPLLRKHPGLAVEAGNSALVALAQQEGVDLDMLEAIERRLPPGPHADLALGMAVVSYRLIESRIARDDGSGAHAVYRAELAERLHFAGFHEEAVRIARGALDALSTLARGNEVFFRVWLNSLNAFGTFLAASGERAEALAVTEQAVTVCRKLLASDLTGSGDEILLAEALGNLGERLSDVGRHAEALDAAQESVAIRERFADDDRASSGFAASRLNFGARLAALGRHEEALAASEDAVTALREAARTNPETRTADLAMALNNYGRGLLETGHPAAALEAAEEAVTLWRELVQKWRLPHEPGLAMALRTLGACHGAMNHPVSAIEYTEDAVTLYRKVTAENPGTHENSLASALFDLTVLLRTEERHADALPVVRESVTHCRRLVAAEPTGRHQPKLAQVLVEQGLILSELGWKDQAHLAVEEAVEILRDWVDTAPDSADTLLARTLYALGRVRYDVSDDLSYVLAPLEECLSIYRRLAAQDSEAFADSVRAVEDDVAKLLRRAGKTRRRAGQLGRSAMRLLRKG